jgi:hypothetical protein
MNTEGSRCCRLAAKSPHATAYLLPTTLVQHVGEDLLLLDQHSGDVLHYPPAWVSYHPTPTPHLAVAADAQELLHDLHARGLVASHPSEDALVTRRTALGVGASVAGGAALALSLPGVALASSVVRRPGFWTTNEVVEVREEGSPVVVDRTEPITIYVWVSKTVFPEITDSDFLTSWFATVAGQNGAADYDNPEVWVFRLTLPPPSALHTAIADFEDGLTAAPTIQGTVSNDTTTIAVLFTREPSPPSSPLDG